MGVSHLLILNRFLPSPSIVVVVVVIYRNDSYLVVKKQAILDKAKNSRISDGGRRWVAWIQQVSGFFPYLPSDIIEWTINVNL